jgi:hypothetical protein
LAMLIMVASQGDKFQPDKPKPAPTRIVL